MFTFQSSKKTASCRRQSHRVGVSCASSVPPPLGPTLSSPAETTSHNIRVLSTQQHTMLLNSLFYVSLSTTVYFIPIWVPIYSHSYTGNASLLQLLQVSQDYGIWTCTVRKWHLFSIPTGIQGMPHYNAHPDRELYQDVLQLRGEN